ncbi:MAG TPA: AAA family ATPase [Longimicrobiales bacterium]
MGAIRFLELELDYGRHAGERFTFPDGAEPVVVAGPNGAGKTTLLEALVRAPFGFHRRNDDDRTRLEARRPWTGERYGARVVIAAADGSRWAIERDFTTARVRLTPVDAGGAVAGDTLAPAGSSDALRPDDRRAAPGAAGARAVPAAARGRSPAAPATPWAGDGNPGADNAEAREYRARLAALLGLAEFEAYRVTACIQQGELTGTRLDGALLRIAAGGHGDVDAAKQSIVQAHRALTQRPIAPGVRRGNKPRALETLEAEIARTREEFRRAVDAEARRQPLLEERAQATSRMAALRDEIERLEAAQRPLAERRALEAEQDRLVQRLRTLEEARAQAAAALEAARPGRRRLPIAVALAAAGIIAGGALALAGRVAAGLAIAVLGLGGAAALTAFDRRARTEREHRRQGHEAAARRLAGLVDGRPDAVPGALADAIAAALEDARRELARTDLALETARAVDLALPDGVPPDADAVARALARRRAERDALARELRELERRLLEEASIAESPLALRDRLAALEARRAEIAANAAAHEAAYALLQDAYAEFRERDEERLLARISSRLGELTAGALGPVEAPDSLAGATLRLAGRAVPIATPPLSYGEWHAALLAIRLGAADFLAGAGIALPLLVDEPFAFLDPDRAREVWTLLRAIARERQVIVVTQDRLTLEWLGVTPDIQLEASPATM